MTKLSLDVGSALGEILLLAVGTSLLSTLGVYIELLAIGALTTGQLAFGLWLCLLGANAFYFGLYAMGFTELFPRLQLFVTQLTE